MREEFFYGFGKVLTTIESCDHRAGASSEDSGAVATDLSTPLTAMPRVRTWKGGLGLGFGGVLGELLVQFGGLSAGDDFDDIGTERRADLDFEPAFVGPGDVDGFVGGDECVAAVFVWEQDDSGAIALMAEDAPLGAADAFPKAVGVNLLGGARSAGLNDALRVVGTVNGAALGHR